MIQRRLYIYIVAAASLAMLLIGLVNLGSTAINQILNTTSPYTSARDAYAGFGAVTLVGLPVWGIHWWLAQRFANRNADERASAIRRLYLYVVLAATGVGLAIYLRRLIEDAFGLALSTSAEGASITRAIWAVVILSAFWAYHFRTAAVDRATVGETGVSATLRRWYAYPLTFLGLGWYFGWYTISSKPGTTAGHTSVEIDLNKKKFEADVDRGVKAVGEGVHKLTGSDKK